MLEFLIDNIFVVGGGEVFQQSVEIRMGTNCAPSLADLFLYSYEAEFIQKLLLERKKSCFGLHFDVFYLSTTINSTNMYIVCFFIAA
jgi:hypothetical protein